MKTIFTDYMNLNDPMDPMILKISRSWIHYLMAWWIIIDSLQTTIQQQRHAACCYAERAMQVPAEPSIESISVDEGTEPSFMADGDTVLDIHGIIQTCSSARAAGNFNWCIILEDQTAFKGPARYDGKLHCWNIFNYEYRRKRLTTGGGCISTCWQRSIRRWNSLVAKAASKMNDVLAPSVPKNTYSSWLIRRICI